MRNLRKPNGADRNRLFVTALTDMNQEDSYYLFTTARVLRQAQSVVGVDHDDLCDLPDTQRILVHARPDTKTWKYTLV